MSDQEIREELAVLKQVVPKSCKATIEMLTQYLKAEGLPDKIPEFWKNEFLGSINSKYIQGFNEAIDKCHLAISKLYVLREGLPSELEIAEIMWKNQPYMRYSEEEMKKWARAISERINQGR